MSNSTKAENNAPNKASIRLYKTTILFNLRFSICTRGIFHRFVIQCNRDADNLLGSGSPTKALSAKIVDETSEISEAVIDSSLFRHILVSIFGIV